MARDYIIRESAIQRQSLIHAITASGVFFDSSASDDGVSMTIGVRFEPGDYRLSLIEKLQAGIPLDQIPEYEEWTSFMERESAKADEHRSYWRSIGEYKRGVINAASNAFSATSSVYGNCHEELISVIKTCPLVHESITCIEDIRPVLSQHPWLRDEVSMIAGHAALIERSSDGHKSYFVSRACSAWERHCIRKKRNKKIWRGETGDFNYDRPPEVFFKDQVFLFSGKFEFGSRRECQEAVRNRGSNIVENGSRWVNYLVVANNNDNTSPQSTSCSKVLGWRELGWPCFVITEETWRKAIEP